MKVVESCHISPTPECGAEFVFDRQTFDLDYVKVIISDNTKKYPRNKNITRDPQRQRGDLWLYAGKIRRVNHLK